MLKELSKDLNSMKKSKAKMRDILIEIKNMQGNSRVDEAENQIDGEHKETKNNQSEQQEEKKYQKMRIV